LQQRCALGGVGEEAEGLECEQLEIMSDSAAFGSRSPRVFMRFARPIISAYSTLWRKGAQVRWKGVFNRGIVFMDEDELRPAVKEILNL
jgi:hypothetical protein